MFPHFYSLYPIDDHARDLLHLHPSYIRTNGHFDACNDCFKLIKEKKIPYLSIASVDFGKVPKVLTDASRMEVNMIAKVRRFQQVFTLKTAKGADGYKFLSGFCLAFNHDAPDISATHLNSLPRKDLEHLMYLSWIGPKEDIPEMLKGIFHEVYL